MTVKQQDKHGDPDTADRFVWKPGSIVIVKAKPPKGTPDKTTPKGG